MAFTQTDLDRLNAAIATGELSIEKDGKKITYRSVGELVRARDLVIAELRAQSGAISRVTVGYYEG